MEFLEMMLNNFNNSLNYACFFTDLKIVSWSRIQTNCSNIELFILVQLSGRKTSISGQQTYVIDLWTVGTTHASRLLTHNTGQCTIDTQHRPVYYRHTTHASGLQTHNRGQQTVNTQHRSVDCRHTRISRVGLNWAIKNYRKSTRYKCQILQQLIAVFMKLVSDVLQRAIQHVMFLYPIRFAQ